MSEEMIEKVAAVLAASYTIGDTWEVSEIDREAARAAIAAYNPNERLIEALLSARRKFENLAMIAGDGTAVALQSYAEIGGIDEALSPLPQGEDT